MRYYCPECKNDRERRKRNDRERKIMNLRSLTGESYSVLVQMQAHRLLDLDGRLWGKEREEFLDGLPLKRRALLNAIEEMVRFRYQ